MTDALQTSAQFAANQVLIAGNLGFNLQDAVANAFLSYASIKLEYHDTDDNLPDPPPGSPGYPDWPDPENFFFVYDDYAAMYHDTLNYPWVVFYVKHLAATRTDTCGAGLRLGTSNYITNQVVHSRKDRNSFVFVNDVQDVIHTQCGWNASVVENVLIHAVTHEYGHQRAGLTHNDAAHAGYHQGSVPAGRQDVMAFPENFVETGQHHDAVFDSFGNEIPGEHSSCRGNLLTNQTVR